MLSNPITEIGRVERSLQNEIQRKADRHEIHTLRGDVDRLEHTVREIRAALDGLRDELSRIQTP